MAKGVDYAFRTSYDRPSVPALQKAGVAFVGRYVSTSTQNDRNGKNLIPSEKNRLLDGGLGLILYCEEGAAGFMKGGRSAGVGFARHAVAVASALNMPTIPFFYAADWDATETEQSDINAFLDGTASVHGVGRNGIYGGYYVVRRTLNAGKARFACQTIAWSSCPRDYIPPPGSDKVYIGGGYRLFDQRAQIRQTITVTIDGVNCDLLESMATDFGQWPRPVIEKPIDPVQVTHHLQEEDMLLRADARTSAVSIGNGQFTWISFFCDNTVESKPAQVIRVAPWVSDDGGQFSGISTITVSTSSEKPTVALPPRCAGISLQRIGDADDWCPVAFNLGPVS